MQDMRTTVNIDEHLLVAAKQLAAATGRSLGDILDDALRVVLVEPPAKERVRVVLPTYGGSGLRPGASVEDKEALAELMGDNLPPGHPDRDDSWQLDAPS